MASAGSGHTELSYRLGQLRVLSWRALHGSELVCLGFPWAQAFQTELAFLSAGWLVGWRPDSFCARSFMFSLRLGDESSILFALSAEMASLVIPVPFPIKIPSRIIKEVKSEIS